jgi:hypothetical protein
LNLNDRTETARELRQPSAEAAAEFEAARDGLAEALNRRMAARPDLENLIGPAHRAMMEDNSRNFCRFMASMFLAYEPEVLVQTVLWVFRAYRSHGFQTACWPANLDAVVEIARQKLPPSVFEEIHPFFHWLVVNIPSFVKVSDEQLAEPLSPVPRHDTEAQP